MNTLYIVPTPIGNLEDITLRAIRTLREVSLIAAEDTRTSRVLLDRYQIETRLTSYHEHNKLTKLDVILDALRGGDVALISDAGTPGISDPGYELIREAIQRGVKIVSLPGASAVTTALVASGLPTDGYVYLGFLPRKDKALRDFLETLQDERRTLIAYESPNRLLDSLGVIQAVLGDRPMAVARELSKLYEEIYRGRASEAHAHFSAKEARGEITLVIGGAPQIVQEVWDEARVREALIARLGDGESRKDAARLIAEQSGWNKRDVYNLD